VLRKLAAGIATLGATIGIAACGGDTGDTGDNGEAQVAESGPAQGTLTISQWPAYIDPGENGTIAEFEKETGVKVEYIEDINDNVQFFGKMQPLLDRGESGGRDIIVVTEWMAKQMYDLGYLQELDHADLPTVFDNLRLQFQVPVLDPDRKFSIPWQAGMTGIWVNTKEAPDIRSVNDLFDPRYKGRVAFQSEMRDSVSLTMKADGIDPAEATKEDWLAAIDKIEEAADSGQIRRFAGQDYVQDINSGNVVAAIGWSGDATLVDHPDAEWRMPTEGCMLWADTMVIPVGAPNTAAALEFMNFVYEPEVQADIAAWVNYATPVEGTEEILAERDPKLARDERIFPDEEFTADCTPYANPPGETEDVREVTESFEDVVSG
jgi:spermidine/putrescine transport system substrate-binding protein